MMYSQKGNKTYCDIKTKDLLIIKIMKPSSGVTWQEASLRISPKNFRSVKKIFRSSLSWFYDKEKNDLYVYDENNNLRFNMDYKDLEERLVVGFQNRQLIGIRPDVIEYEGSKYEGVYFWITRLENGVMLTYLELEEIVSVLEGFSFQEEDVLAINTYMIAKQYQRIEKGDSFSQNIFMH